VRRANLDLERWLPYDGTGALVCPLPRAAAVEAWSLRAALADAEHLYMFAADGAPSADEGSVPRAVTLAGDASYQPSPLSAAEGALRPQTSYGYARAAWASGTYDHSTPRWVLIAYTGAADLPVTTQRYGIAGSVDWGTVAWDGYVDAVVWQVAVTPYPVVVELPTIDRAALNAADVVTLLLEEVTGTVEGLSTWRLTVAAGTVTETATAQLATAAPASGNYYWGGAGAPGKTGWGFLADVVVTAAGSGEAPADLLANTHALLRGA